MSEGFNKQRDSCEHVFVPTKVCDKCSWVPPASNMVIVTDDFRSRHYKRGLREGLTRFAWWRDGVQYVGTCGTTLEAALKEVGNDG